MILLILGIVALILAITMWVVAIHEDEPLVVISAICFTFFSVLLIWSGGCGFTRSLDRQFTTNIKVISACTNEGSVIIVGIMPNQDVRCFEYSTNNNQSRVIVGQYHYVVVGDHGTMKLVPFEQNNQ